MKKLILSSLSHLWLIDVDGTIFIHNGYLKNNGFDEIIPEAKAFIDKLPKNDIIILLTSRRKKYKRITLKNLKKYKIRYNKIIFNCPFGERIVINDKKPSGLNMAMCINFERNKMSNYEISIDEKL